MEELSPSSRSEPASSGDTPCSSAFSANARYMAPLSRLIYPSFLASRAAIVLLPEPAGPSIAIISLWDALIRLACLAWDCALILGSFEGDRDEERLCDLPAADASVPPEASQAVEDA